MHRKRYYIIFLFICGILLLTVASASAQKDTSLYRKSFRFEITGGLVWTPSMTISELPEILRAVPVHSDDWFLPDNEHATEILPNKNLTLNHHQGGELTFSFFPIRYFSIGVYSSWYQERSERYQQNQFGDSNRGIGTSLRWYQGTHDKHVWGVQTYIKTAWSNSRNSPIHLRGTLGYRYNIGGLQITAQSGWDRWSSDELWKIINIGTLFEHRLIAGIEFGLNNLFNLFEKDEDIDNGVAFGYIYIMTNYTQIKLNEYYPKLNVDDIRKHTLMIGLGSSF